MYSLFLKLFMQWFSTSVNGKEYYMQDPDFQSSEPTGRESLGPRSDEPSLNQEGDCECSSKPLNDFHGHVPLSWKDRHANLFLASDRGGR